MREQQQGGDALGGGSKMGLQSQQLGQHGRARGRPSVLNNSPGTKGKDALTDGGRLATKERRGRNTSVKGAESAGEAREDFEFVPLVSSPPPDFGEALPALRMPFRRQHLNGLLFLEGTAALTGERCGRTRKNHARSSSRGFCWEASYPA